MKSPRKIYLIDDDEDDRMLLKSAIEKAIDGIMICEFESAFKFSGDMALDLVTADSLILLDINMPKMDGLELLRELRLPGLYCNTPVLIISTTINHLIIEETRQLGIEDYLAKPASLQGLDELAQAIHDCYRRVCLAA